MTRFICLLLLVLAGVPPYGAGAARAEGWQERVEAAEVLKVSAKPRVSVRGRATVIAFFASWCPPCRDEFTHLNTLIERRGEAGLAIVGVNVFENWGGKENPARMSRFIAQTQPLFPLVKGTPAMRALFGDIERIPSLIVFDAAGREIWRFVHARGANKTHATMAEIETALQSAAAAAK